MRNKENKTPINKSNRENKTPINERAHTFRQNIGDNHFVCSHVHLLANIGMPRRLVALAEELEHNGREWMYAESDTV